MSSPVIAEKRSSHIAIADKPARDEFIMLSVSAKDADATGGEPIFLPDGTPIGQVSSGAYGYHVDQSLALGYIKAGSAKPGAASSTRSRVSTMPRKGSRPDTKAATHSSFAALKMAGWQARFGGETA